jgi:hypothetical protein
MIPDMTVTMNGYPLSDAGLENALLLWPNGAVVPLQGFPIYPGQRIIDALLAAFPYCVVYADDTSFDLDIPIRFH